MAKKNTSEENIEEDIEGTKGDGYVEIKMGEAGI